MIKIYINNEEVLCDKNINIKEELLTTSSTILNNVFPKSWDTSKDYTSQFYFPLDYSKCKIYDDNDLIFCGVVKNTGNISLNPREPHYASVQVLDFKTFLSEGETLDFVINNKTIEEAISLVVDAVSDYGVVLGNIQILNGDDILGAYSTQDKTAYDVFNYLADISQSKWYTRLIDEDTIAVDFYDSTLLPSGDQINYTKEYFEDYKILDLSYSLSSQDYRNKQVMYSDKVVADITTYQKFYATGLTNEYITTYPISKIDRIYENGAEKTYATTDEKNIGISADYYYEVGKNILTSDDDLETSTRIELYYYPIISGRRISKSDDEINRINQQTGRKGIITRYETRNDTSSGNELELIADTYIKYKGTSEITLKIQSNRNIWNIGQLVYFNAPLEQLKKTYMVKSKEINIIASVDEVFYTYELSSSLNSETAINYFDNQRAKQIGNISDGKFITRNVDLYNTGLIEFYDLDIEEYTVSNDNIIECQLDAPFVK